MQSGRQSSWRTGRSNCLMRRMCTSACILWIMRQGREAGRGRKRSQEWPFCTESTTSGATGIRKRSFPKRRRKFWISCTRWSSRRASSSPAATACTSTGCWKTMYLLRKTTGIKSGASCVGMKHTSTGWLRSTAGSLIRFQIWREFYAFPER